MKRIIQLLTCFLSIVFFSCIKGVAQQAEQKVLFTLQEGEDLMFYESCIPFSFKDDNLYLVTRKDNQFYTYENGTKSGPFQDAQLAGSKMCNDENTYDNSCSLLKYENQNQEKFLKTGEDGTFQIDYKGKTYRDFSQILEMVISPDGNKIAVSGLNKKMEPLFLTPDGTVIQPTGEIQKVLISASGNLALIAMKGSENVKIRTQEEMVEMSEQLSKEMESVDFSTMTPEEIAAFSTKLQEKYGFDETTDNNPDYYFWFSDGKKYGPFKFNGSLGDNPAFSAVGGDNWYFIAKNNLYVNGSVIKDFLLSYPVPCNVWISPDGKRYAAFLNYESMIFSDGQKYPSPMQVKTEIKDGKAYLIWLAIDTNKQLILYRKAL